MSQHSSNNDILSSRETSPVDFSKSNSDIKKSVEVINTKPRIFQKLARDNSFGSINFLKKQPNQEKSIGSEINCITVETQTDWSYLEDIELVSNLRKHLALAEWKALISKIEKEKAAENQRKNADSDESDFETDEQELKIDLPKQKLESIGPPKILQFKPEIKEVIEVAPSPTFSIPGENISNVNQFMQGFNVYIRGGEICEFCEAVTNPWPTIAEQEEFSPEQLYCCSDYKEYVDGLIKYQTEKEKLINGDSAEPLTTKLTGSIRLNNPQVTKIVKDRDDHNNMQKLLNKQKKLEELAARKQEQLQQKQQKEHTRKEDMTPSKAGKDPQKDQANANLKEAGKESTKESISTHSNNNNLLNQMKSINYQLSNLKYLQDGWTVRPRSRLTYSELSDEDDEEINLLTSNQNNLPKFKRTPFDFDKRVFERSLVIKKYKDGKDCLILFPDGSGNVFYPSGRLAISIISIAADLHAITVYNDSQNAPVQIAQFDPFGNGTVNFSDGSTRLILSPQGGLELESDGRKKKRWQWSEMHENHVHAPPFQSLTYVLNSQITVKLVNQIKINVDFIAEQNICKFRIKIKPKVLPVKNTDSNCFPKHDSIESYLSKKKFQIEDLFRLMSQEDSNILKLPRLIGALAKDVKGPSKLGVDVAKIKGLKAFRKPSSKFVTV